MIIVPCLLFFGISMEYAIGTSIVQMIFSSVFGSILNIWRKKLDLRAGFYVGLGGLIGAIFSGMIVANIHSTILLILFILFTLVSVKKYIFNTKKKSKCSHEFYIAKSHSFFF